MRNLRSVKQRISISAVMKGVIAFLLCLAGFHFSSTVAGAFSFTYSESVSGDLSDLPTTAFGFDVGANTVSGTTHFAVDTSGGPHFDGDFDNFAFTIPTATTLSSISLAFITTTSNVSKADIELELCPGISDGLSGFLGTQTADLLDASPLDIDFGGAIPIGPGVYTLRMHALGIAPISTSLPESWSADYTWTLNVIPEPGSVALIGLSLISLGITRRRFRGMHDDAT